MSTFTLAISCLTTSNLLWFMDLTFQVPMQYCSLQHQTLLLSPVTSTAGYCFFFGSIPSFFLELFLHLSPVAYWAPTDLGSPPFSILSFCLFILFIFPNLGILSCQVDSLPLSHREVPLLYCIHSIVWRPFFKKMLSFLSPDCLFLFVLLSVFYFSGPARCLVHLDCVLMIKSRGLAEWAQKGQWLVDFEDHFRVDWEPSYWYLSLFSLGPVRFPRRVFLTLM